MKLTGFFLTLAGFFLSVAALLLLPALGLRYVFVLSGLGIEFAGLTMVIRGHRYAAREGHR